MFHKQKTFNLEQETKTIVLTSNTENPLVKKVLEKLSLSTENFDKEPTTVFTLGKLAMNKVIFLNEDEVLKGENSLGKMITLKEDVLVLVDSFKKETIGKVFELLTTKAIYRFDKFKSKDEEKIGVIHYFTEENHEDAIHEGIVYGEAINHTKQLVNTPYNYLNAFKLADYAQTLGDLADVDVKVYGKKACEDFNMGAFLGVNKGSKDEPQLIHIRYTGNQKSKEVTALVGKGVMYDTGGYSLKTPQGMPSMKCDMAGAATVLGAIEIIARLKYPHNVDVVIAATDNRIGDDAIVPDDILTAANGTTIEIISTDAEGRLTLADALWFAQKEGAQKLIDVATLTGAVVGALGAEYTGAFTNHKEFMQELLETADKTEEKIWQLPITKGYHDELKSFSADIKNSSGNRMAGASVAAAFLENFVEKDRAWIHLDIAGTSFDSKKGASGTMVKTLASLFKS